MHCSIRALSKVEPGHRRCTQGVWMLPWLLGSLQMRMLPFCSLWKPLSLKVNHFYIEMLAFSLLGFCQLSRYTSNAK